MTTEDRNIRLGRAFSALRCAADGDLGRAMAARAAAVAEIDRLTAALAAGSRFADLVVIPTLARITDLTDTVQLHDAAISRLRQRRSDVAYVEKRLAARANVRRREAVRRQDRNDLIALTDAAAGWPATSFPQGEGV